MILENFCRAWPKSLDADGVVICGHGSRSQRVVKHGLSTEFILMDSQYCLAPVFDSLGENIRANLRGYPEYSGPNQDHDGPDGDSEGSERSSQELAHDATCLVPRDENGMSDVISRSLSFQKQIGMTALIMPSPPVDDAEDEFGVQLAWLKAGVRARQKYDRDVYFALTLSEQVIGNRPVNDNHTIRTAIDNLQVEEQIDGVYLCIMQQSNYCRHIISRNLVDSLFKLVYELAILGEKRVIVNYVDILGFACLALGATAFGTGYSTKCRRLTVPDYGKRSGGRSYPTFYSHRTMLDLRSESDLNKLSKKRLIRYVFDDLTPSSESLIRALKLGGSASSIPDWAETINNTGFASRHRMQRLSKAVQETIRENEDAYQRAEKVLTWLQDAEAACLLIEKRLSDDPLTCQMNHVPIWRAALEDFAEANM